MYAPTRTETLFQRILHACYWSTLHVSRTLLHADGDDRSKRSQVHFRDLRVGRSTALFHDCGGSFHGRSEAGLVMPPVFLLFEFTQYGKLLRRVFATHELAEEYAKLYMVGNYQIRSEWVYTENHASKYVEKR